MPLKILTQEKITQTSGANSEQKRNEIERFSTLKTEDSRLKRLRDCQLSISSVTCTNQSL